MSRRVAIVGTRPPPAGGEDPWQHCEWVTIREDVERFLAETVTTETVIVSGGARGVDAIAEAFPQPNAIHRADWKTHGKVAGFLRNQQIVDDASEIHAWPSSWSRGTWDTIRRARAAGKPCTVHEPWKTRRPPAVTLLVHTDGFRSSAPDRLDITRKSATGDALTFAPSWPLLSWGLAERRAGRAEAAWATYAARYLEEMRAAYARDRRPFDELLARESVTLVCYCPAPDRCHRRLLAEILVKLGARQGLLR